MDTVSFSLTCLHAHLEQARLAHDGEQVALLTALFGRTYRRQARRWVWFD